MKLQRLKNNDLMIIIPAKQAGRWRLLTHCALDWIESGENLSYRDKETAKDIRILRRELNCRYGI